MVHDKWSMIYEGHNADLLVIARAHEFTVIGYNVSAIRYYNVYGH